MHSTLLDLWVQRCAGEESESLKAGYEIQANSQQMGCVCHFQEGKNSLRRLEAGQAKPDTHLTSKIWEGEYDSKKTWRSAKSLQDSRAVFMKTSSACVGIHNSDGEFVYDPRGKAEVFKAHDSRLAAPSNGLCFSEQHCIDTEADVRDC